MADAKKVPPTKRTGGGRVTPKGGAAGAKARAAAKAGDDKAAGAKADKATKGEKAKPAKARKAEPAESTSSSGRYTPPSPRADQLPSPAWVPVLMFVLFGLGMLIIFLNYVNLVPGGESSNWYLLAGLGLILGGIITATQYR
ncbi:MAG: cell division protein CrgA [Acidimicrobiales bacterium]